MALPVERERESGNTKSSCDVPSAFVGKMQVAREYFIQVAKEILWSM